MPSFFKLYMYFPLIQYMKKKASFYYIIGSIVEIISIIVIAVFAFLPSAMKENFAKYESFLGWICFLPSYVVDYFEAFLLQSHTNRIYIV